MNRKHSNATTTRRSFLRGTAAAGTATAAGATLGSASAQSEPDYGDWFDDVSNFDGTYDFTGESEVTVDVGAPGNGGNLAFSPAAIRVDPGTTVVWEWTGKGSVHNVVAEDGSFGSDRYSTAGETYERTFDSEGTFEYLCEPHVAMGMKGAVVVGGSGGKDPSELESESSGGESGSSGESGGSGAAGSAVGFTGATIGTVIFLGLLSPILFGLFLLLNDSDRNVD